MRLAWCIVFAAVLLLPGLSFCTEEYAQKTGQNCSDCHIDPSGGGELTATGKAYQATILSGETGSETGLGKRIFRLVIGFVHIVTGFFWFGTILYIHLVLKPHYAAHGLPKGEKFVGLISMGVMAITGSILTSLRVTSPNMLFHTRFGILLTIKIAFFLIMVAAAVFVVLIVAPRLRNKKPQQVVKQKDNLTLTELSQYDGKEGKSAFFAYKGQIFDASTSKLWVNGVHMGRHNAGADLTEVLQLAPHGEDKIIALPATATLAGKAEHLGMTPAQKVFFFMAYLNLAAVFSIILILALWRWW